MSILDPTPQDPGPAEVPQIDASDKDPGYSYFTFPKLPLWVLHHPKPCAPKGLYMS